MLGRALCLLALVSCENAVSEESSLAIHLRRGAAFAGPIDDLHVQVDVAGEVFEHATSPTEAFEAGGDVLLFLPGTLRGPCVVGVTAVYGGREVAEGAAAAVLGTDADVVIEIGPLGEGGAAGADTDLRGWWRFEESSGDEVDASTCGNDAVAVGHPFRRVPGIVGYGVALSDGAHFVAADSTSLDVAGDLTIEAWIRADALSGNCGTSGNAIVAKWHLPPQGQYLLSTCSSGQLRFLVSNGSQATVLISRATLTPGEPVHVAGRFAGEQAAIFVDGRLDVEMTAPAPAATEYDRDDLYIGAASQPGWSFEGLIDEVKLWSQARRDEDICRDAGGEPTGKDCDLSGVLP